MKIKELLSRENYAVSWTIRSVTLLIIVSVLIQILVKLLIEWFFQIKDPGIPFADIIVISYILYCLKTSKIHPQELGLQKEHIIKGILLGLVYFIAFQIFFNMLFMSINPNIAKNYSLSIFLIIPISEELLTRGMLFQALVKPIGVVPALILTSVIFAFFHGGEHLFPILIGGLFLNIIFIVHKKNLYICIAVHSLRNFMFYLSLKDLIN